MAGMDLSFEDVVDEVEEDICIDDDEDFGGEEDIAYVSTGGDSGEDDMFDAIIGTLEEIIMDDDFNERLNGFMTAHCTAFHRGDENSLECMDIFQKHTALIEEHIERGLSEAFPDFTMESFLPLLEARHEEVGPDLFDMLLSLSDFEEFKEQMLGYKEQVVEGTGGDLVGMCLTGRHVDVHEDEMEDGDARLDLMDGLSIKPLSPVGLAAHGAGIKGPSGAHIAAS